MDINWQAIISNIATMIAVGGFFWSRLDRRFDKIDEKFDRVDQDLKELRTSLNRIEGAFYSKDCCMLKQDIIEKKAE